MGSDKAEKKRLKLEKKRLKAQVKLEKARAKAGAEKTEPSPPETPPQQVIVQAPAQPAEKLPWYKDPEWVRALVAAASLIVALVAIVLTFY